MSHLSISVIHTGIWQNRTRLAAFSLIVVMLALHAVVLAEGTKQLEPKGAPLKSVCKLVLLQNDLEYRVPFALLDCKPEYRLNISISDFTTEKIYLGFGNIIDYFYDSIIYNDVSYQLKDPAGNIVPFYSLQSMPLQGDAGFILTRDEVDMGPDIENSNPGGYKPLILTPEMNGDYVLEFKIPDFVKNKIRIFKYFDVTVSRGTAPVTGRLWSKAWQLGTCAVSADISAAYSKFYILNDSIVTRFDCNGLAGGVWSIYSNEWGCSTTGVWNDRRRSVRGNATVQPEFKIFLNDPDPGVFPSGHLGKINSFNIIHNICDAVVNFEANVNKGGNIEILLDAPPFNNNGSEDVKLEYTVTAGHNVMLPAWDGKDRNGNQIANGTQIKAHISFLNDLTNLPLYDIEDNPNGFKVDIERPVPVLGSTKIKLYWDDTQLPASLNPTSNVAVGCSYTGLPPKSGCHAWTKLLNLGDTNTVNSWWYLTTDEELELSVILRIKPKASFSWYRNCVSQVVQFTNKSTGSDLVSHEWDFGAAPVKASNLNSQQPDAVFHATGTFPVSLMVTNQYGCKDTIVQQVTIHGPPEAAFNYDKPCQGAGITFTDQSIAADATLNEFTWIVNSPPVDERTFKGNPKVIVFDDATDHTVSLIATDLFGCTDTVSRLITIIPKPDCSFEIIENSGIDNGVISFKNHTTGASAYLWDFGNTITSTSMEPPVAKYSIEGDYPIMLVATNFEGCMDTATRHYYYLPGLWLPNAFSPDNNEHNDVFRPVTRRNTLEPYQMLIYNRWGQLLFKSSNPSVGWDGNNDGKPCKADSYIYVVQYREDETKSSEIVTKRGIVSLIR